MKLASPTLDALTILVIHYNTPELLSRCTAQLSRYAPSVRTIVVDSSPPDTLKGLRQRLEGTTEIFEASNHSFAHALNRGLREVSTPYVAHMNADVFVKGETFPALLAAFEDPRVAIVGPIALTSQGRPQHLGPGYALHYRRLALSKGASIRVPWLSGCLQVLKLEAAQQVGGMDASLRFYNEDVEWCFRLRRAGRTCLLVKTEVLHLGGASTPDDPRFLVEGYRGGYRLSQRYKSHLYRAAHRAVVLAQSAYMRRFAKKVTVRRAFAEIFERFREGSFDESPFGDTLNAPSNDP